MNKRPRAITVIIGVLGATLLFGSVLSLPRSEVYHLRASCLSMPQDDSELAEWLKRQPGVIQNTVHAKRTGNFLDITFIQVRNGFRIPSFPDLKQKATNLKYVLQDKAFEDVP